MRDLNLTIDMKNTLTLNSIHKQNEWQMGVRLFNRLPPWGTAHLDR